MVLNLNSMYITTDEKLDVNQGLSLPCNIINSAYNRMSTSHSSDGLISLTNVFLNLKISIFCTHMQVTYNIRNSSTTV